MTTKGPSRKQVIIPMSKDNIDAFMKNSSLHVANVIAQGCGQTLGLGLGQSKDIVVVFY